MRTTLARTLRRLPGVVLTLGLVASAAAVPAAPAARAAAGDRLKASPTATHVATTGSTFTIRLTTNTVTPVTGVQASVTFSTAYLAVMAVARPAGYWGSALAVGGDSTAIATANATGKLAQVAAFYLTPPASIPTGSDVPFLDVTFKLKSCPSGGLVGTLGLPIGAADAVFTKADGTTVLPLASDVTRPTITCGPRATLATQPVFRTSSAVPLAWTGVAGDRPVASYDLRYRRAAWNGAFGAFVTILTATTATSTTHTAAPGYTYCYSVRAKDTGGTYGPWSAERCTAIALDDRSLTRGGTWTELTGSQYYRSTALQASATSSALTATSAQVRRLSLVATTCSTCGTVIVTVVSSAGTTTKTLNLASATTVNRVSFSIAVYTTVRTATITIKPGTAGRKIIVDGLAISRT